MFQKTFIQKCVVFEFSTIGTVGLGVVLLMKYHSTRYDKNIQYTQYSVYQLILLQNSIHKNQSALPFRLHVSRHEVDILRQSSNPLENS